MAYEVATEVIPSSSPPPYMWTGKCPVSGCSKTAGAAMKSRVHVVVVVVIVVEHPDPGVIQTESRLAITPSPRKPVFVRITTAPKFQRTLEKISGPQGNKTGV